MAVVIRPGNGPADGPEHVAGARPPLQILMVADETGGRRWIAQLAERLAAEGHRLSYGAAATVDAGPTALQRLMAFERAVYRLGSERLSDRLGGDARFAGASGEHSDGPDIVIDLSGADQGRGLRVLYDGRPGEAALFAALVAGRMPLIEVENAATGAILARGLPASDNAETITEAADFAFARAITLLSAAVRDPGRRLPPLANREHALPAAGAATIVGRLAGGLAFSLVRRIYHLGFHAPHWRICWRFVDGADVWDRHSFGDAPWSILPDPGNRFYADPVPFVHDGRHFIFFEDLDHRSNKGRISMVELGESGPLGPARSVLEEPWHLSYPFLIEDGGEIFMIPEASANREVALYRAAPFPDKWVKEAVLLSGFDACDATILRKDGKLWMFCATRENGGSYSDTLSIFIAENLKGPWRPHPANPLLIDAATARPAGNMVLRDGRIWRPAQDCRGGYGTGVSLVEVLRLDEGGYEQKLHKILPPLPGWPGKRFHTLSRAGRLECIDGAAHSPKLRWAARWLEAWSGRRDDGTR